MTNITASLTRIRKTISALEAQIDSLHVTERELETLAQKPTNASVEPQGRGKAAKSAPATAPAAQPLVEALADVLDPREQRSVAVIAERLGAAGRQVDTRAISFALQALKKKGLARKGAKGWLRAGKRAKTVTRATAPAKEATASEEPPLRTTPAPQHNSGKQTVAEIVASILQRSGPLALADLGQAIKKNGREVSAGTLSNTLQILKKKGVVTSADGKWAHKAAA